MEFWNSVGSPTCIENNSKIKRIHEELQEFHNENKHVLDFMPEDYRNNSLCPI